jgi:hypothetical protein
LGIVKTINSGFVFVSEYFTPACSSGQAENAKGEERRSQRKNYMGTCSLRASRASLRALREAFTVDFFIILVKTI